MGKVAAVLEIVVGFAIIPLAIVEPTPAGELLVATLVIDGFRRLVK